MAKTLTATEVVRNFSDILNRVRYQSAEFDIVRGKEVVARLRASLAPAHPLVLALQAPRAAPICLRERFSSPSRLPQALA